MLSITNRKSIPILLNHLYKWHLDPCTLLRDHLRLEKIKRAAKSRLGIQKSIWGYKESPTHMTKYMTNTTQHIELAKPLAKQNLGLDNTPVLV